MPSYKAYRINEQGKMVEVVPEEFAKFLGISEFNSNLMLKGLSITKTICTIVGKMEDPPLIWNKNMPVRLVKFVTEHVAEKLKSNPAYSIKDFDFALLYDGNTLKYY